MQKAELILKMPLLQITVGKARDLGAFAPNVN